MRFKNPSLIWDFAIWHCTKKGAWHSVDICALARDPS